MIRVILVLVAIFIIYALADPLSIIYSAAFKKKYKTAMSVTSKLLTIGVVAVSYFGFKEITVSVLKLALTASLATKVYDAIFLIAVVIVVYGIIKELTKLPGEA